MSEYSFIINQTIKNHADDMSLGRLIREVKDWMDSENVDYCHETIDMVVPQCLEIYRERQKESIRI